MSDLWQGYVTAAEAFANHPSPSNMESVIAAYTEWITDYEPKGAAESIGLMRNRLRLRVQQQP